MTPFQPVGPAPARIMIVGEALGEQEELRGEPFVGSSGMELSRMLHEAGIDRSQCFITNVVRVRPKDNDIGNLIALKKSDVTPAHGLVRDKYCLPPVWEGINLVKREISMCRPHVIIAFGNVAMWALTGKWGITSWRGSVLTSDLETGLDYSPKVVPAYHPAAILRQWSWRPILIHDLRRAVKEAKSKEITRPDYHLLIRSDFTTTMACLAALQQWVSAGPTKLAVDIETRAGHIACIGIAWSKLDAICIPLMCAERREGFWNEQEEAEIAFALYKLLTHPNAEVIGQNFLYDAQYFYRWFHFLPNFKRDTMLAQHTCFSNLPKGLDFLSSMYCEHHVYWKSMHKVEGKVGE